MSNTYVSQNSMTTTAEAGLRSTPHAPTASANNDKTFAPRQSGVVLRGQFVPVSAGSPAGVHVMMDPVTLAQKIAIHRLNDELAGASSVGTTTFNTR